MLAVICALCVESVERYGAGRCSLIYIGLIDASMIRSFQRQLSKNAALLPTHCYSTKIDADFVSAYQLYERIMQILSLGEPVCRIVRPGK